MRTEHNSLNAKLERIEDYITLNGVPQCDYTRFQGSSDPPLVRFQEAVRRLISLKKLEAKKRLNFTDLINVLGKKERKKQPSFKKDSDDNVKNVARRLSKNLYKISHHLQNQELMMESLQQLIVQSGPRNSRVLQLAGKKRHSVALTEP